MAHVRRHALPVAGRLPDHACGADVGVVEAEELLRAKPVHGCAAVVLEHAEWGEGWQEAVSVVSGGWRVEIEIVVSAYISMAFY